MIKFVSSNWFAAKSVEQMRVEQSQFEQFTPTRFLISVFYAPCWFETKLWNKFDRSWPGKTGNNIKFMFFICAEEERNKIRYTLIKEPTPARKGMLFKAF